ncbi:hypothetical protein Dsin_028871 [Dipteronia sinensis]|uniref:SWIM-type domain-containing protein n=1 Tax=Dipteronia sinensis TaxID=43782 RepID=A0AAE0DUT6_9ROSI|nr:hypothetical protein Dsin_028871 [Dipteronia sinensis]
MLDDSEEDLNYEPYSDYVVSEDEGDESEDNLSLFEKEADDDNHHMDSPYNLNGDNEAPYINSSEDETGVDRMYGCNLRNEWKPDPNGQISLQVGQVFESVEKGREVLSKYAIQEGFELDKSKNDARRLTYKCKGDECSWRIHLSYLPDDVTFKIRSITGDHVNCRRMMNNNEATTKWVASVTSLLIRDNPNVKAKVLQTQIKSTYGVEPSKSKIYRAKRKELKMLKSNHVDCYGQLRKYGNILLQMNPGSLAVVGIDTLSVTPKFQRFFLSFNAQLTGFIRGCRPFIGLDGCHLKGPFGVVLLSAIGLDSDSGIFPIAVCVVENEFIFGKPLIRQIDKILWRLWRASKQFGFDDRVKSDHVSNNMSKCFNNWVNKDRDKPMLTLFEILRRKYMVRFQGKQAEAEAEKWTDNMTPYVRNRIKEVSEDAKYLQVWYGRGDYHETVDRRRKTNIVHLGHRTCDCGLWQVSGLPCEHAAAAIIFERQKIQDYVHPYLTVTAFKRAYDGVINPIPDSSRWPNVEGCPPIPPDIKSRVERPKNRSRRREVDEGRPRKRSSTVRCTNCEQYGHNRSTCTNPRNPSMGSEKRRNRQPRRRIKVRSETGARVVQGSQGGTFVHSNLTDIGSQIGSTSQIPGSSQRIAGYFGVPIFSYNELVNHQDKELGDGGKLRDGRVVAVKRLYKHNNIRVEQFMNEIEILPHLRHTNIVCLYGCTSHHSQGLLLVYEFIPNGTVADHLHGDQANSCLLTWPIRMNIAIETACALAYLHASDIVHCDVTTDNILLDQ